MWNASAAMRRGVFAIYRRGIGARNEKPALARPHAGAARRHHSFAALFIYVGLRSGRWRRSP
jgi:hypothetical protein